MADLISKALEKKVLDSLDLTQLIKELEPELKTRLKERIIEQILDRVDDIEFDSYEIQEKLNSVLSEFVVDVVKKALKEK